MAEWKKDPIKIVPASNLRHQAPIQSNRFLNSQSLRTEPQTSTTQNLNSSDIPINSAFYPPHNGFVRNYQAHAYTGTTLDRNFPPQIGTNTLNPTLRKYQRFRTPPRRHVNYHRHGVSGNLGRLDVSAQQVSSGGTLDTRYVRSFSGPLKRPAPIYQKNRDPRPNSYHLAETYGTLYDVDRAGIYAPPLYLNQPVYLSATLQRKAGQKLKKREEKINVEEGYPLAARLGIKLAEFIFGLVIIGLILSPTSGLNLAEFLRKSSTEWQGVVLSIVACVSLVTAILLLTIWCANSNIFWRRIDIVNSAISSFLYLIITCIETYYAACYPPNGIKIALVCYRIEWIIAAVLCFFQIVIYITDVVMALRTGTSLL